MDRKKQNWGEPPWKIAFRAKTAGLPAHVDVAIVGGGFAGLTAAAYVKRGLGKRNGGKKSVLVLEAGRIGDGASGRTGGMALAQSAAGDLPGLGDVLKSYKKILRELDITAELDLRGVWEIARGTRSMEGKRITPIKNSPIDWNDSGRVRAVKLVQGGTVNPGKVVAGLARAATKAGVLIEETARVVRVQVGAPVSLQVEVSEGGKIWKEIVTADRVLLTTNAGAISDGNFSDGILGERKLTFALATAPLTKKRIAALGMKSGRPFYTVDLPYLWGRLFQAKSSRSKAKSKNRGMIFGAGLVPAFGESLPEHEAHQLWSGLEREDVRCGDSAERLKNLEQRVRALHPALAKIRVTHRWGGPILITPSFVPVFRAHPKSKNVILLGGFSGHGVAQSVYLGRWAAEVLLGKRALAKWR